MKCPFCQKDINLKELQMRSLPQNKYYWKCIVQTLSDELGYTKDEIHELLRTQFLNEVLFVKTKEGVKEVRVPRSTRDLKTIEFEDYCSQIRTWASVELGIWLPEPNEGDLP